MKKTFKLIALGMTMATLFCGCGKTTETISNTYTVSNEDSVDLYDDTPLSSSVGFSNNIAVIGIDSPNSEGSENIFSESALVIDTSTGDVVFQKNPHKKQYPASTTKILTALCAVKYGDVNSSRTAGQEVIITENNAVLCDYRVGDVIPFDVTLHGALLKSGNDAAAVLALFAADTSDKAIELMNTEAKRLGATESNFVNPHGLYDEKHYTTPYDLYLIVNEAIKYPKFVDAIKCVNFSGTLSRTTANGQYVIPCAYTNTNEYVLGTIATPEGLKVLGGKAGYTELAKRSYVMLVKKGDIMYIVITMRCDTRQEMYSDLTYLLNKIPVNKKTYADNE